MELLILNKVTLAQIGIVTGFSSLKFTRALNSEGKISFVINANNETAKYIGIGRIVYIDDNRIGYIKKVTSFSKDDNSNDILTVEGIELKDQLDRMIYPASGNVPDQYTNEYVETIVKTLISKNAGILATTKRLKANITLATDQSRGSQIDYSAWYKDLSTEIYNLLKAEKMGLRCTFDGSKFIYDVYQGNDLTATAGSAGGRVLSINDVKTALSIKDIQDESIYKNLQIVAGSGSPESRTTVEVYTEAAEPEGWDRSEGYTEASDATTEDELAIRGAQKLAETEIKRAISVEYNPGGAYQLDVDFTLGDFISTDSQGELYDAQIVKIIETYKTDNTPDTDLILDFDITDDIIAAVKARHMDYNALMAAGSGGGGGNIVEIIELTSTSNTIIFSDKSINDDGGVYDLVVYGVGSASVDYKVLYNGIAENTSYKSARSFAGAAYSYSNNARAGRLATIYFNNNHVITLANGKPSCNSVAGFNASTGDARKIEFIQYYSVTQTDINEIRLEGVSGNFNSGTVAVLSKRN